MAEGSLGILHALGHFTRIPPEEMQNHLSNVDRTFLEVDQYKELLHDAAALSTLNPKTLAPTLTGIPTLMIAVSKENILPSDQSNRLYESLGHPERWTYTATHGSLFYILPTQAKKIDRWINRATNSP